MVLNLKNKVLRINTEWLIFSVFLAFVIIFISMIVYLLTPSSPLSTDSKLINTSMDSSGNQIIDMTAKGGFSPSKVVAKSNTPTILRVATKNTFDCSSTINIPSLQIQKNLKSNASTDIEIPPQTAGSKFTGTCSQGLYNFTIEFI